jgi:hypothetical protein
MNKACICKGKQSRKPVLRNRIRIRNIWEAISKFASKVESQVRIRMKGKNRIVFLICFRVNRRKLYGLTIEPYRCSGHSQYISIFFWSRGGSVSLCRRFSSLYEDSVQHKKPFWIPLPMKVKVDSGSLSNLKLEAGHASNSEVEPGSGSASAVMRIRNTDRSRHRQLDFYSV